MNTAPKFTPGPWHPMSATRGRALVECAKVIRAGEMEIARIDYEGMPTGSPAIAASDDNARLIAAAPELYEALREANEWLQALLDASDLHRDHTEIITEVIKHNRAALSKAAP